MALLDTLVGELLGPRSTQALSQGANASSQQVQQTVTAALPLMLSGMLQNAGTAEGAQSLEQALAAHAPAAEKSTSSMLKKADVADGKKIVKHVLGDNEAMVTDGIARSTGLSQNQVSQLMGQLAPVMLSLVGNYKEEQTQQSGSADLTSLLGGALLGGGFQQVKPQQQSGLNVANLAGALLGGSSGSSSGMDLAGLAGSLLGGGQTQTQSKPASGLGSLLGGLLGSSKPQQQQSSGTDLSGLLMGLLK